MTERTTEQIRADLESVDDEIADLDAQRLTLNVERKHLRDELRRRERLDETLGTSTTRPIDGVAIEEALDKIAASVRIIASEMVLDRVNRRDAVRSRWKYLRHELSIAERRFEMSDVAVMKQARDVDESTNAWNRRNEQALNDADVALRSFLADHPELDDEEPPV